MQACIPLAMQRFTLARMDQCRWAEVPGAVLCAGALEEVDWLRMKLERIEGALKDQVGKGGTLARIMSRQMDRGLLPEAAAKQQHDLPSEQASAYGRPVFPFCVESPRRPHVQCVQ